MLEDRPYMRENQSRFPWRFGYSASITLMIVLTIAFALQCINDVYIRSPIELDLALGTAALRSGHVWQFLTFQFFHGSLWHLIGNLLGLWFFGQFVENILGKGRFLVAYFGAGIVGGLLQCVLMLLFPFHFAQLVFGASAGVLGMFAIFARLEAGSTIRWNFIIPIRADVLLWITAAISFFFTVVPTHREAGTAHAAHLGGIIAGLAWVKFGWHRDYIRLPWEGLLDRWRKWKPFQRKSQKRELVKTAARRSAWGGAPPEGSAEVPEGEFISRQVDPILDKISAHGIQSLTEAERKILEAARKKMKLR
jgi:membrane associated rhomboid family serine protease